MIASVMTTRRAGRPIDFHIPTRLKSIGCGFLRNRRSEFFLAREKAAEPTQADPRCQRDQAGRASACFAEGERPGWPGAFQGDCLTARRTYGNVTPVA